MALAISIVLFTALMAAISAYGYRRYARPARVLERLGAPVLEAEGGLSTTLTAPGSEIGWIVRVIQQVGEKVPISPEDAGVTRRDLMMAGYKSENAVKVFNGIRVALGVVLFVFAIARRFPTLCCASWPWASVRSWVTTFRASCSTRGSLSVRTLYGFPCPTRST
jgi:hypothetical protein